MAKITWPEAMSTAEKRAYQQICDPEGKIFVIALDQRNGMRQLATADEETRKGISMADLGEIKADIVQYLGNYAPAVLLDPECALPRVVDEGILARDVALVVGMDASGWKTDENSLRQTQVVPGITARRVRELGGTAGKLMMYMRPDKEGENGYCAQMFKKTTSAFVEEDVLLVVEILIYKMEEETSEEFMQKRPALIKEAARIAIQNGAKVLKLQYPGSAKDCAELTQITWGVPWALLSDGVDHETYLKYLTIAMDNGAAGAIAGRALWKDSVSLDPEERKTKLEKLGLPRLHEILSILDSH
jgi:tagatose-1,6-bisphosphate aldolase